MKSFGNAMLVLGGIGFVSAILAVMNPFPGNAKGQGDPGGPRVTVVNTGENPVPTTIQGGTISGEITGEVSVNNLPPVQDVAVQNSPENPVPVRVQENAGIEAFTVAGTKSYGDSRNVISVTLDLPDDRVFIVDHVSISVDSFLGEDIPITGSELTAKIDRTYLGNLTGQKSGYPFAARFLNKAVKLYLKNHATFSIFVDPPDYIPFMTVEARGRLVKGTYQFDLQ